MPTFKRNDVSIYYEEYGSGYPILLFAPGGMRSSIEFWAKSPFDPTKELAANFRVIAMDQRNAGKSSGPITANDGWDTYTGDHIALIESGLPFETDKVDLKAKTTESGADFTEVNPKGYVPALRLDEGGVLTENIAILSYIADRSGKLRFFRARGSAWRARRRSRARNKAAITACCARWACSPSPPRSPMRW